MRAPRANPSPEKEMQPWERVVKKPKTTPAPPVAALADHLLEEILRRLPDMASLLSAALACKSWGRVASHPAVFSRLLPLRRPLLVGFLLTDRGRERVPFHVPNVCFITASPRHPKLAFAASHGDFYYRHHPQIDDGDRRDGNEWRLRGCGGGRLLLSRGRYGDHLAVYDPLERTAVFFGRPDLPHRWYNVRYAIVGDASFQVVAVQHGEEQTAVVFSSRTRKWALIGWDTVRYQFAYPFNDGLAAGQFVYWPARTKDDNEEEILVLDMKTMEWSVITAPFPPGQSYCVADMAEHGGLCIVSSQEQCVKLWVRHNNGGWAVKKEVSLLDQFGDLKKLRRDEWMKRVRILAMKAGYVYMEFWSIRKTGSYLLVLNLNTVKLQIIRNSPGPDDDARYRGPAYPFFLRLAPIPAPDDDKTLEGA